MRRALFYARQTLHNCISFLTAAFAILALCGWLENGYYLRAVSAGLYLVIWTLAQYIPGKDGKRHNTSFFGGLDDDMER